MPGRRSLIALGACLLAPAVPRAARAEAPTQIQVWRDPDCGCCHLWIPHLQAAGFTVQDNRVRALAGWRRMLGVPSDLLSCHVARVGGFAIEGHVPPLAIRRLLAERPEGVRGLAVPGMPVGSPGMEVPGREPDTYDVIAFGTGPHRAFMRFRGTEPV
ncbi:metal-binding protein [Falsiroseomonas bella]|uniref:Metal-binding protein n=1 Tax=Falsiroseomonas bella TaxID=2184016 RepID=A0A317F992_9PROT|nr:DUF411 domain-containing protein [Falsiroseomonas bella]PWS34098.1 metal-binding protein [Falsiroseomonas bella]